MARAQVVPKSASQLLGSPSTYDASSGSSVQPALQDFADSLPVGVQRIDVDGVIRFANTQHAKLFGKKPEDLVGRPLWELCGTAAEQRELRAFVRNAFRAFVDPLPILTMSVSRFDSVVVVRMLCSYSHHRDGSVNGLTAVTHPTVLMGRNGDQRDLAELGASRSSFALSNRENAVVDAVLAGTQPSRIAEELGISVHTVRNHLKSIYRRLGVHSKQELFAKFMRTTGSKR